MVGGIGDEGVGVLWCVDVLVEGEVEIFLGVFVVYEGKYFYEVVVLVLLFLCF